MNWAKFPLSKRNPPVKLAAGLIWKWPQVNLVVLPVSKAQSKYSNPSRVEEL